MGVQRPGNKQNVWTRRLSQGDKKKSHGKDLPSRRTTSRRTTKVGLSCGGDGLGRRRKVSSCLENSEAVIVESKERVVVHIRVPAMGWIKKGSTTKRGRLAGSCISLRASPENVMHKGTHKRQRDKG